jgi:hypothetical protein
MIHRCLRAQSPPPNQTTTTTTTKSEAKKKAKAKATKKANTKAMVSEWAMLLLTAPCVPEREIGHAELSHAKS